MPYIPQEARGAITKALQPLIDYFHSAYHISLGELNFAITRLLLAQEPQNYKDYNELIGLLECVKQEFYRRAIIPYEEAKKEREGDVY